MTYAVGDLLNLRVQVLGTSPTTVRAKVWKVGTVEPAAWQRSVTDTTAGLQASGSVGLFVYHSSSATNAPNTVQARRAGRHRHPEQLVANGPRREKSPGDYGIGRATMSATRDGDRRVARRPDM